MLCSPGHHLAEEELMKIKLVQKKPVRKPIAAFGGN